MSSLFSADFFNRNRRMLRAAAGGGLIVVIANGLLQRGGDSSYRFAQDANFWYLTGLDDPDLLLVMDDDREFVIVPERSVSREAFDGAISADLVQKTSGISMVVSADEGWRKIGGLLEASKKVKTLAAPPAYIEQIGLYTNPARQRLLERLDELEPGVAVQDIGAELRHLRSIKQPSELKAIQNAIDITIEALKASTSPNILEKYKYEYELEAALSQGFRSRGALGHAFDPIVASGERACTLHNVANQGKFRKNQLIVLDVGAEFEHYAADISRTVSYGKPTARQQEVHAAVCEVQDFAKQQLKPGIYLHDYEEQVREQLGEKLQALGLIKKPTKDNIRHYYPHATSHFLGLNVHDVGDYDQPLRAGMVLTVEPGIYIHEEGIGVRIEDDVLITEQGCEVLSNQLPRNLF